jgi:hypothetical protein
MKSAARFGLALITTIVALIPARAEADSYTFSKCLSTTGLCESLAPQLSAEPTGSVDGDLVDPPSTTTVAEQYFDMSFLPKVKIFTTESNAGDAGLLFDGAARVASYVQGDKFSLSTTQVHLTPEPASMFLFGLVAFGVAYRLRRRGSAETGSAS